jgi:hypothetical protein
MDWGRRLKVEEGRFEREDIFPLFPAILCDVDQGREDSIPIEGLKPGIAVVNCAYCGYLLLIREEEEDSLEVIFFAASFLSCQI